MYDAFINEDYSDGYDNYAIRMSYDNGKTWTGPVMKFKSSKNELGKIRCGEPSVIWDQQTEKLIVVIDFVHF